MERDLDVIEVLPAKVRSKPQLSPHSHPSQAFFFPKKRSREKEVIEISSEDEIEEIKPTSSQRLSMKRKLSSVEGPNAHEAELSKREESRFNAKHSRQNLATPTPIRMVESIMARSNNYASSSETTLDDLERIRLKSETTIEIDMEETASERESDGYSIRFSSEEITVKEEDEDSDVSMDLGPDEANEWETLTRKQQLVKISSATHEIPFASRPIRSTRPKDPKRAPIIRLWSRPYLSSPYKRIETDYIRNINTKLGFASSLSRPVLNTFLNIQSLRRSQVEMEVKTSGSITKVAQSGKYIVVASAARGGDADSPEESASGHPHVDDYNTDGNLLYWTTRRFVDLEQHSRTWFVNEATRPSLTKTYTVNDVAFDPTRTERMVSSGCDRIVNIWDFNSTDEKVGPSTRFPYPDVPYDINFKPGSRSFAVGCYDGNIRVHSGNLQAQTTLDVCANSEETVPGAFLWGGSSENQRLSNHLFALSEIRGNREDLVCKHSAFDVERERRLYTFEMGEQGDALALNPKGDMLALTTNPGGGRNSLYLYDVARSDTRRPTHSAALSLPAKRTAPTLHPSLPLSTSSRQSFSNTLSNYRRQRQPRYPSSVPDVDMDNGDDDNDSRAETQLDNPNANETETGESSWYEINFAAFAPDSTLIALARTDNVVLVYDSRFLGRGESGSSAGGGSANASSSSNFSGSTSRLGLERSGSSSISGGGGGGGSGSRGSGARAWACLRHPWRHAHSHARSGFGYGITGLQWVEGLGPRGGLGLVTGGSDGCVRLWDIMRAPTHEEESLILAEADNDIACFSLGDQSKGEKRLVVGDCGGRIYVYD